MKSFCKPVSERQNVKIDFSDEGQQLCRGHFTVSVFVSLQGSAAHALKHSGVRALHVETARSIGRGFNSSCAIREWL